MSDSFQLNEEQRERVNTIVFRFLHEISPNEDPNVIIWALSEICSPILAIGDLTANQEIGTMNQKFIHDVRRHQDYLKKRGILDEIKKDLEKQRKETHLN